MAKKNQYMEHAEEDKRNGKRIKFNFFMVFWLLFFCKRSKHSFKNY
jgi:hypothetical protein